MCRVCCCGMLLYILTASLLLNATTIVVLGAYGVVIKCRNKVGLILPYLYTLWHYFYILSTVKQVDPLLTSTLWHYDKIAHVLKQLHAACY